MSQPVNKVPVKETNNHKQGRSGGKVMTNSGPAVGSTSGNPTAGGAIHKSTTPSKYK